MFLETFHYFLDSIIPVTSSQFDLLFFFYLMLKRARKYHEDITSLEIFQFSRVRWKQTEFTFPNRVENMHTGAKEAIYMPQGNETIYLHFFGRHSARYLIMIKAQWRVSLVKWIISSAQCCWLFTDAVERKLEFPSC